MVIMDICYLDILLVVCFGSLLVIGLGMGENFIVFDQLVLLLVICCFIFFEEGDIVEIICCLVNIFDNIGVEVKCQDIEFNL